MIYQHYILSEKKNKKSLSSDISLPAFEISRNLICPDQQMGLELENGGTPQQSWQRKRKAEVFHAGMMFYELLTGNSLVPASS